MPTAIMRRTLPVLLLFAAASAVDDADVIDQLSVDELETPDAEGFNALHRAAVHGENALVAKILGKGVDVNIRSRYDINQSGDTFSMTALSLAADKGHDDVVTTFIDDGVEVDLSSPLVLAASAGHVAIAHMLLNAGADINLPCAEMEGATALLGASMMGQDELVGYLLEAGADPLLKNNHGATAMVAASSYAEQMALNEPLRRAIEAGGGGNHKAVLKRLRKAIAAKTSGKRRKDEI